MRAIQRLGAANRATLTTATAGAFLTLAACGSQVPTGQSASLSGPASASQSAPAGRSAAANPGGPAAKLSGTRVPVALCMDIPHLTAVVITRGTAFRTLQTRPIQPRGITIAEPGVVRGLAVALCALPPIAPGRVNCPAQLGGSIRFDFVAGGRPFLPVTVQVSGCRVVTGLGPPRAARSAAFWQTLDMDLGGLSSLPSPNASGGIGP